MPKVTLRPSLQVIEISSEQSLLEALKEADVYIKSSCGGHATCSDCILKVVSGEDSLSSPPFEELKLLGNVFHITKERLACQTKISGDVTLDISRHDKARDQEKTRSKTTSFVKKKTLRRTKEDQQNKEAVDREEREERPPKQTGFRRPKRK